MTPAERIAQLKQERESALAKAELYQGMIESADDNTSEAELSAFDKKLADQVSEVESLGNQIKDLEAKKATSDKLAGFRDDINAVPKSKTRQLGAVEPTQVASVRDRWLDDPCKGWKRGQDYFADVIKATQLRGPLSPQLSYLQVNEVGTPLHMAAGSDEQSTFNDAYGGFLVPEGFSGDMLSVTPEPDPMAGRVTRIPMASPVVNIPARTDKTHTTSVTGGLRFYRRAEADTVSSSRMQMEKVKLEATALTGIAYVTEELLNDSVVSFAALLQAGFRDELTSTLIEERLQGTGAGEFTGINNAASLISVTKETGQAADTIVYNNVLKMRARVWGYQNAVWIGNHDIIPQLATLNQAVGTGGQVVWAPSAREDVPDILFGRPIYFSEYAETLGDAGDLVIANWSQYLEGIYQPLESAESMHVRFIQNERTFKFNMRNAGAPWWLSALTPRNGSTLSPFVRLAARA